VRATIAGGRWPDEGRQRSEGQTLLEVWARHWQARPDLAVLVDGWHAERVLEAAALDRRTAQMATVLAHNGLRPGDRVIWHGRASLTTVPALLGALRAGGVVVPLNTAATAAEVAHVVRDAGPVVALTDRPSREDAHRFDGVDTVLQFDELAAQADGADPGGLPEPGPHDDALIVYTSGTTGTPKGATHTHASLLAGVEALRTAWAWRPEDRLILALPLFHVHGLCAGLFGSLAAGASATVFDRFDEEAVLAAVPSSTMFFGVPTMYHRLAATTDVGALGSLRLCVSGSAPLAADLWHHLAAAGVPVLERYGMTETLITLSNPVDGERRAGSVGFPLPGVEAAVDDADEHGIGELLVRGPALCRGYWGQGPLSPDGWFATGDLVSVADDGYVTIRGRRSDLIITGGHNVYPAEVEAVLARHPGVAEVAVVGVPSDEWGETVVAFVVGDPGLDLQSLREAAAAQLASFKCPREVRLVDALPRSAMGKVLRKELH
jgi:malonyl-CoA/methylmalonyl-CoA synthetase